MNPKVAKKSSQIGLSLVAAMVLGFIVKLEHHLDDKIEEHYDQKDIKKS